MSGKRKSIFGWPDVSMYNAKALYTYDTENKSHLAVFQTVDDHRFDAATQAEFERAGFVKMMRSRNTVFVRPKPVKMGEILKIFPDARLEKFVSKEFYLKKISEVGFEYDLLPFDEKANDMTIEEEVDILMDLAEPEDEQAEDWHPPHNPEREARVAEIEKGQPVKWVKMDTKEPCDQHGGPLAQEQGAPEAAVEQKAEAPEVAEVNPMVEADLEAFKNYMIFEGIPHSVKEIDEETGDESTVDIRDQYIEAARFILTTPDVLKVALMDKPVPPKDFRKAFVAKLDANQKHMAKASVVDKVYGLLLTFNDLSDEAKQENAGFAEEYADAQEQMYAHMLESAIQLEEQTGTADVVKRFTAAVKANGTRWMANYVLAESSRSYQKEMLTEKRFSLLTTGQLQNYKSPFLTKLKKDDQMVEALRETRKELFSAPAPSASM